MDRFRLKVRQSRLRWCGHVKHWDDGYAGRKVLDMSLPGNRRSGRPKRRWERMKMKCLIWRISTCMLKNVIDKYLVKAGYT